MPALRKTRFHKVTFIRLTVMTALFFLGGCKYEKVEVEIGYLGEARRNPFLAAQRLCSEYGLEAETLLSLKDMPHHHTTLILSADAVNSKGMTDLVSTWVSEGGTLIYLLEGATRFQNDFEEGLSFIEVDEDRTDLLLGEFEVRMGSGERGIQTLKFQDESYRVHFRNDIVFETDWVDDEEDFFGHKGPVFEYFHPVTRR